MTSRRLFLSLLASVWACDERAAAVSSRPRVVSLSPSTTEAMFAIGAGALLVGRSQQCDHPEEAKKLPSVGGYASPNAEAVIALRPTLVIGEQGPIGPQIEDKLRAHGVATFFPSTDSVAEITAMIRELGAHVDRAEVAAEIARGVDARVAQIAAWASSRANVSLVMVFDVSPIFVAGPGSFPDELLRLAGGKNLITRGGKWPTIDVEHLRALDPRVIVDAMGVGHGTSRVTTAPGFQTLTAVKEGRVRRLASAAALRPGPRIAEGLADVARSIQGQAPP